MREYQEAVPNDVSRDVKIEIPVVKMDHDHRLTPAEYLQCQRLISTATEKDWRIREVTEALTAMKSPPAFMCVRCPPDAPHGAGYSPKYNTAWICGNRYWRPAVFRRTLLHELIHAFDFARAKIDPSNCDHVACSEVRAANLSGECGMWATLGLEKRNFPRAEGVEAAESKKERCVAHKAVLSLEDNKNCAGNCLPEKSTDRVLKRCMRDYWPFVNPPELDWSRHANKDTQRKVPYTLQGPAESR